MEAGAGMKPAEDLRLEIESNTAVAGVVGLGYVGLPLSIELARSGFRTIGFDVSQKVVDGINDGVSHVLDVDSGILKAFVGEGLVTATSNAKDLRSCDVISICVPMPL